MEAKLRITTCLKAALPCLREQIKLRVRHELTATPILQVPNNMRDGLQCVRLGYVSSFLSICIAFKSLKVLL